MYYIYCYTNKINGHKYVGQTNNLKRRIREHSSCAFNPKASSYNDLIHMKIREYGEDNFEIEVLEILYTTDQDLVNKREQYWIQEKESFCGTGKGYNRDYGGFIKRSSMFSDEQLAQIRQEIKDGVPYFDLQMKYKISASFLSSVNQGTYLYDENEQYPLRKFYRSDDDYDELIELLTNSTLTLSDIAKRLGLGYSTVKKINAGTLRHGMYPTYPIRQKSAFAIRADHIKNLLLTTDLGKEQIAKICGASVATVERVNNGVSFRDENLTYPLSNL